MAKKLSVVQLKQQANVLKSLEAVEELAMPLYPDFVGCWFSLEYEHFPGSLLVRCQFNSEAALAAALEQKLDLYFQKQIHKQLFKCGILVKDIKRHVVLTTLSPDD
ncbi:hypothetical protein [Rheinheimera mangrovi]|uniref:hypothetical protein n=1 Tax=Rheinheimera mangrovi TaxID=2498451 RepID=UPI000F8C974F|nr:hypothetical protein [Rheinheimera mangrovi]